MATAFVLLGRATAPDVTAVVVALRTRHPDIQVTLPDETNSASPLLLRCNGQIAVVMHVPHPLPRDQSLLRRAKTAWPQVDSAFDRHAAHLIVSLMGAGGDGLPAARIITAVVGGLLSTMPDCLGVVWGAKVAYGAELWLKLSAAAFAPYPDFPTNLWIGMHPFRNEQDGGIGVLTQGLVGFVGRELELLGGSTELTPLLLQAHGLMTYLVQNGPVIADGNTFGISETERVTAHLRESSLFPGLAVISAAISGAGASSNRAAPVKPGATPARQSTPSGAVSTPFSHSLRRAGLMLKWSAISVVALILALLALGHFLHAYAQARAHGQSVARADLTAQESLSIPIGLLLAVILGRWIRRRFPPANG